MSDDRFDPVGVCVACFVEALKPLIERRYREQPPRDNRFGAAGTPYGVLELIALESGVSGRRLYEMLQLRAVTVGLRIVDEVFLAFDRPDLVSHLDTFPRKQGQPMGVPGEHVCPGRSGEPATPVVPEDAVIRPSVDRVSVSCPKCGDSRLVRRDYARKMGPETVCKTCSNRATADAWAAVRNAPGVSPVETASPLAVSRVDVAASARGVTTTERKAA